MASYRDVENVPFFTWPMIFLVFAITAIYYYFVVYFSIEIITRTDIDLQEKTNWQLVNTAFPLFGNVFYYHFGHRENATFK